MQSFTQRSMTIGVVNLNGHVYNAFNLAELEAASRTRDYTALLSLWVVGPHSMYGRKR